MQLKPLSPLKKSLSKKTTILLCILIASLNTGCDNYIWVRQDGTTSGWDRDFSYCKRSASMQIPASYSIIETKTSDKKSPSKLTVYDINAGDREKSTEDCLKNKGWIYIPEKYRPHKKMADGTDYNIVEKGGYCNVTDDCVRGLFCLDNKCRE